MSKKEVLYLFTAKYPFGNHETFLEREILFLSEKFNRIFIVPYDVSNTDVHRPVPSNVEVVILENRPDEFMRSTYFTMALVGMELSFSYQILRSVAIQPMTYFSWSKLIGKKYHYLADHIQNADLENCHVRFYSYWMNEWSVILAVLKRKKIIDDFIFRVHGFDLYEERSHEGYIFIRGLQEHYTRKIVTACEFGRQYLIRHRRLPKEKIFRAYLGVKDYGAAPFNKDSKFTIVSCSNLVLLKRVHLIPEILNQLDFPLKWVHIGDGEQMESIKNSCTALKPNIEFELKGRISNLEINEFYQRNPVHLFIHLSESEGGVPVVLQEAGMAGIPLMAVDAGGVSEIVKPETGILIPSVFTVDEISSAIKAFLDSEMNTLVFRNGVRNYVKDNFHEEMNYRYFIGNIF